MIPAALGLPVLPPPCSGAPTVSSVTPTDSVGACLTVGWVVNLAVAISGSLGTRFEIEIWRKAWTSPASEPASYTFFARKTSAGTYSGIDGDMLFSSSGTGASETRHRKYMARIVPASSANGAGPFCDSLESSQLSRTANLCTE